MSNSQKIKIKLLMLMKALTTVGPLFFSSLFLFVFLSSCQDTEKSVHLKGATMGTHYNVKFYSAHWDESLQTDVDSLLKGINQQMSTYIKTSEISYFNQFNRLGWLKISPEFFNVTKYALELAERTQGKYDPTIGPLVNLWGFGPKGERKVPKDEDVKKALLIVGHDKVLMNDKTFEIKKKVPGVYLDLSSLAKGHGVDAVAEFLTSKGIKSYMVEIGGEVRTSGEKPDHHKWSIAIEAPNPKIHGGPYQKVIKLNGTSMATSGNYRNFFESEHKRYSHTIDTLTGRPVIHRLASVSVIDASCMKADALATALMAMGPDKGFKFAKLNKIPAYFVYGKDSQSDRKFVTKETQEFSKLFTSSL